MKLPTDCKEYLRPAIQAEIDQLPYRKQRVFGGYTYPEGEQTWNPNIEEDGPEQRKQIESIRFLTWLEAQYDRLLLDISEEVYEHVPKLAQRYYHLLNLSSNKSLEFQKEWEDSEIARYTAQNEELEAALLFLHHTGSTTKGLISKWATMDRVEGLPNLRKNLLALYKAYNKSPVYEPLCSCNTGMIPNTLLDSVVCCLCGASRDRQHADKEMSKGDRLAPQNWKFTAPYAGLVIRDWLKEHGGQDLPVVDALVGRTRVSMALSVNRQQYTVTGGEFAPGDSNDVPVSKTWSDLVRSSAGPILKQWGAIKKPSKIYEHAVELSENANSNRVNELAKIVRDSIREDMNRPIVKKVAASGYCPDCYGQSAEEPACDNCNGTGIV